MISNRVIHRSLSNLFPCLLALLSRTLRTWIDVGSQWHREVIYRVFLGSRSSGTLSNSAPSSSSSSPSSSSSLLVSSAEPPLRMFHSTRKTVDTGVRARSARDQRERQREEPNSLIMSQMRMMTWRAQSNTQNPTWTPRLKKYPSVTRQSYGSSRGASNRTLHRILP